MVQFKNVLLEQIKAVLEKLPQHFEAFPISSIFLFFFFLALLLNIVKAILIWLEKKHGSPHKTCRYLLVSAQGQDCDHLLYRKSFKEKGNCEECKGKSFDIANLDAEQRVVDGVIWKRMIILLANWSKGALAYIAFFYTLVITILNSK